MPSVQELKATKFTFKQIRGTGPYASFQPFYCEIKIKGRVCGTITSPSPSDTGLMTVGFKVVNPGSNCGFKWVRLKKTFNGIVEAKSGLNEMFPQIIKNLEIFLPEKE